MATEGDLAATLLENAELRDSLEQCSAAQKKAEAEAQQARSELHDFVYAAGHDLQEPLRAVTSFAQLLERRFAADPEAKDLTSLIIDGAARATALVQALLSYSRIGNSLHRKTLPLSAAIQPALFKLSLLLRDSGAEVTCGELPEVNADEAQLTHVFEQLIKNAIVFRSSELPRVNITAEEGSDGYVVSVRDNGLGIDSRFLEFVFAPFKRLHGKEVPGAGLGLAVCRKIISAHGGTIWVESDGKQGSNFQFTLPY